MTSEKIYYISSDESNNLNNFCIKILRQDSISKEIKWILIIMSEVNKWNKQILKCIEKFTIGEKEKKDFITWLMSSKYPHSHIIEISKMIGMRGNIL
jgi:hypothetical protein